MTGLAQNVRYALRGLKRSPGFTTLGVLTLALGIGANSAIFSFADATLLRPLRFEEAEQLVQVSETRPPNAGRSRVAFLNFVDWREQNNTFESMAAVTGSGLTMQAPDGTPEQVPTQSVTVDFFRVFRVRPILGRTFAAEDVTPKPNVVVLSEGFWRTRFGADPTVLGRALTLSGQSFTVIGVVPASFRILQTGEMWVLFSAPPGAPYLRRARFFDVVGRLRPGVTIETARADVHTIAANLATSLPETNTNVSATVDPLAESVVSSELRLTSQVLIGVVLSILLIACANVASLFTVRGIARRREFAVRAALGAGRERIVMHSLTESLLLAILGGTAGLGLCAVILQAAPTLIPPGLLPPSVELSLNWRVIAFCAAVSAMVGVVFGIAPARQATRVALTEAIGAGTRGATTKLGAVRNVLTVVEIAAAVLLLCGAGLLIRTLHALTSVDPGYRAERVLTMRVNLPTTRYDTHERMLAFYEDVERDLNALPGVRAAVGTSLPLDGSFFGNLFEIVGQPVPEPGSRPVATYEIVSHTYFGTMGIPIVQGREFDNRDTASGQPVCVVSEDFVRRYLAGQNPIGMRIRIAAMSLRQSSPITREIVGVARQVRQRPHESSDDPQVYVPLAQNAWFAASLVARAEVGEPEALLPMIRAAVARVDPTIPLTRVRTLDEIADEATARPRFRAQLVGSFAILAVIIAMVGLFGLLAFSVQQRVQEFGIRVAVGAEATDIIRLVLSNTARVTISGIVLGLIGAAMLSRFIRALLFAVEPLDLVTFVAVAAFLGITAFVAALTPILRAARVDPLVALRYE